MMPKILSRSAVIASMSAGDKRNILTPRLTLDNKSAVSEDVGIGGAFESVASILTAAPVESVLSWHSSLDAVTTVNGKPVLFNNARKPYSVNEVSDNIFRFEVQQNDAGTPTDLKNGNRRSELVSLKEEGFISGETAWLSWSTVLGEHDGLLLTDMPSRFGYVMQIHSGVSGWPPVCVVNYAQNMLRIFTQSDDEFGTFVVRYSTSMPARGAITSFVIAATLGEDGRLQAWINGASVVDVLCPIGFYNTSGVIGRPQFGIYTKNWNTKDVVFLCNPEWGRDSLLHRVLSPLPVPDLAPWD